MLVTKAPLGLGLALFLFGCSNESPSPADAGTGGSPTGGASPTGGVSGDAGTGGGAPSGGTDAGSGGTAGSVSTGGSAPGGSGGSGGTGAAPTWGIESRPTGQTCLPPASQSGAAMLLSATGCVDPTDPKRPAATLVPYGVSTPLWSDAAAKGRYFALPDGATIDVKDCTREPDSCMPVDQGGTYEDEGDWTFPIGTVFVKTFAFGEKLVETRLLVRAGEFDFWGERLKLLKVRTLQDEGGAERIDVRGHRRRSGGRCGVAGGPSAATVARVRKAAGYAAGVSRRPRRRRRSSGTWRRRQRASRA